MTNTTDPHVKWLEEWRAEFERFDVAEGGSPSETEHLAGMMGISERMANTPATTPAGLFAQLEWFKLDLGYYTTESVCEELKGCIDTLVAGASKVAQLPPVQSPAN